MKSPAAERPPGVRAASRPRGNKIGFQLDISIARPPQSASGRSLPLGALYGHSRLRLRLLESSRLVGGSWRPPLKRQSHVPRPKKRCVSRRKRPPREPLRQAPKCRYSIAKARQHNISFFKRRRPTNRVVNSRVILGPPADSKASLSSSPANAAKAPNSLARFICNPHGVVVAVRRLRAHAKRSLAFDVGAGLSLEPCDNRNNDRVTFRTPRVGRCIRFPRTHDLLRPSRFQAALEIGLHSNRDLRARGNHSPATAPRTNSSANSDRRGKAVAKRFRRVGDTPTGEHSANQGDPEHAAEIPHHVERP